MCSAVRDAADNFLYAVRIFQDITEAKRAAHGHIRPAGRAFPRAQWAYAERPSHPRRSGQDRGRVTLDLVGRQIACETYTIN